MVLSVDRLHWQFGPRHITSFSFLMFRGRCVKRPRSLKRMMTQKLPFEIAEMMLYVCIGDEAREVVEAYRRHGWPPAGSIDTRVR